MTTGILTINLKALGDNWLKLNQKVGVDTDCGAVVKANAYGVGIEAVARSLNAAGCRIFFVATLSEAKVLRSYVTDQCQIFVLGGLCQEPEIETISSEWLEYRLSPVLVTKEHVIRWANFAENQLLPPCAIKVDTGMHRLGLLPEEVDSLLASGELELLSPQYIMSHFACADMQAHPLNQQQISTFDLCVQKVSQQLPSIKRSMANSSGIFLGEGAHYELVRPGAALYGVNPTPSESNPMNPVVHLKLPVMQIKSIAIGESVGYGAEFIAERPTRLAVIFGGYADGLLRVLGNSGLVYIGDQSFPVVGRVSMDSIVADISDLNASLINSLQYVDIINEQQTVDVLAKMAGTIGYEILTNLGTRYQRRYIGLS